LTKNRSNLSQTSAEKRNFQSKSLNWQCREVKLEVQNGEIETIQSKLVSQSKKKWWASLVIVTHF